MARRTWWLVIEAALGVALLAAALWALGGAARRSSFDGDENLYMHRGRYFAHLFLNRDLANPEWGDNYWTHTQPMLTNYLVGGWLWSRGYDLFQMPPPYDWGAGGRQNRAEGRVPGSELLQEARRPAVGMTAGAAVLLFLLGRALGSPSAGLAAGVLLVASPLAQRFMVRALSEAPLAFFIVLTLLLGLLGARRGRDGGLPGRWALAVGVALGLALATKLTAVLSFAALLGWALLVALAAWLRQPGPAGARLARAWAAGRGWGLALALALGVFVASNPHLYANPIEHTLHLVRQRADEMREQQRILPEDALHRPLDRVRFVFGGSLVEHTWSGTRRLPLEAGLAALGTAALLVRTWRGWRRTGVIPAEGLVLLTVATYFGGVSAGLLLAWPHYLVPTLVLGTLLSGIGLGTALGGLVALALRLKRRSRAQADQVSVGGRDLSGQAGRVPDPSLRSG